MPIGLINDAWGGSACEAWIRRDILAADPKSGPCSQHWEQMEKDYPRAKAEYEAKAAAAEAAKAEGKQPAERPRTPTPR